MDLDTNIISISRNVVFHEDIYPFHQSKDLPDIFSSYVPYNTYVPDNKESSSTDSAPLPTVVPTSHVVVESKYTLTDQPASTSDQKRSTKTPVYHLQDYYCNMTETTIPYPLGAHVSYEKLSSTYKNCICSVMHHPELHPLLKQRSLMNGFKR